MSTRRSLAAAAVVVALLGASCGGDDGDDGGSGGGAVSLTASDFSWDPTALTVSSGESIEVVNEDDAEHNLTVEDADVDEDVEAGESVTVDLGDVGAGSYDFVCKYHPDTMTGTLEVE